MESTDAFAMHNNSSGEVTSSDEKDRAEHKRQNQDWLLAKKNALDELYSNLEKYSKTPEKEQFLIDNISNYIKTYNSWIPDLYFSRACLYRKLKQNNLAVADLITAIEIAPGNQYNDTKAVLGLIKIYFESGHYADAINTLENAKKNSGFRTIEEIQVLDYYIQQCEKNRINKNS